MRASLVALALFLFLGLPVAAQTISFGGSILPFPCPNGVPGACVCANSVTYVSVGPPNPGAFVWSAISRTYEQGPPWSAGQYVLGIASVPYYCVLSVFPTIVVPGRFINIIGTSGPVGQLTTTASSTSPWRYPQFTTAAQYDAEEDRLVAAYADCVAVGTAFCPQREFARDVRAEREQRFGPRPI